jgi:uncharacterized membrane protein
VTLYFILKYLHIVGAAVVFGTGAGIAFFMLMAHRSGDSRVIAGVARIVVVADMLFTATAVIAQPVTGFLLARMAGYSMVEGWIMASLALYLVSGALWLPVLRLQLRMRDLAVEAARTGGRLAPAYQRLFRWWLACGIPAFVAVATIYWLMVAKPTLPFVD